MAEMSDEALLDPLCRCGHPQREHRLEHGQCLYERLGRDQAGNDYDVICPCHLFRWASKTAYQQSRRMDGGGS